MGRQVNFWMLEEDEQVFIERLQHDDIVWTARGLPFGSWPELHELTDWKPAKKLFRLILIKRNEWDLLQVEDIAKSKMAGDMAFEPWTLVGVGSSPCFEWDRCVNGDNFIKRGRIYLMTHWLENGMLITKPDGVIRWFDRLANWIRRRGQPWQYKGQYLLPQAARAQKEGCCLVEF